VFPSERFWWAYRRASPKRERRDWCHATAIVCAWNPPITSCYGCAKDSAPAATKTWIRSSRPYR